MLFSCLSAAQGANTTNPQDTIDEYREILKVEGDPIKKAQAHLKLGEAFEELGREREATIEYLNIILLATDHPEIHDFATIAEAKSSRLVGILSEREALILQRKAVREEATDPTPIFQYWKYLYGKYRDQGDYKRAIAILKIFLQLSKEEYYLELGEIYLIGYNDVVNALGYFEKHIKFNSRDPKGYAYRGMAYEKSGNNTEALKSYSKAYELEPFDDDWARYGLKRMEALKFADKKRIVKDWYFLGPFNNSDQKGLGKEFISEEKVDLKKVYKSDDGEKLQWFRPFGYANWGYVDLNNMFKDNDLVVCYAATYAYSPKERTVFFRIGSDAPIEVWLNGKSVFKNNKTLTPIEPDADALEVMLGRGWNEILLKSAETFGDWGFYFRITDKDGNTPLNVIFDPLKDDARARREISKFKRQKGFIIARNTIMFGSAIFVFLLGLYLAVANIYNKIKIRQMKEDFIASVSHELKTPLAAIKMFAETLNMGRVRGEVKIKEYYTTIIRETDRLTRFINKILDFQKIEKGKKIYSFEEVDVKEILKEAVEIYKNQVQDEDFVMEEEYASDLPMIHLDEDAMLQVFLNLLTNAYKYSKDTRYVKMKTKKKDNGITISVTDKGMGISKDKITHIFDRFYRVDRDATKDIKGSGIGLAFVKSVVEAHGGNIAVHSQLNKGSTFMIFLPIEQ